MTRNISLLLVCATILLNPMLVTASAKEAELPGLDVYVVGQHAYVAGGSSGLYVVDISRPANPKRVASVDTPGEAKGVFAISGFAYVADGSAGLQIVDIRNPASPRIIGSVETPGDARHVYVLATMPAWQMLKPVFRSSKSVTLSIHGSWPQSTRRVKRIVFMLPPTMHMWRTAAVDFR